MFPVPDAVLPEKNSCGAFWYDRGDRRHCGIDLYAEPRMPVLAVRDSTVVGVRLFTGPGMNPYWLSTYQAILVDDLKRGYRYAELSSIFVNIGDRLHEGGLIGYVGRVIDAVRVDEHAPTYVQDLVKKGRTSMLHLELWDGCPRNGSHYSGGNWHSPEMPPGLLDPTMLFVER